MVRSIHYVTLIRCFPILTNDLSGGCPTVFILRGGGKNVRHIDRQRNRENENIEPTTFTFS